MLLKSVSSSSKDINRKMKILISDFGESRFINEEYISTGNTGTRLYTSPEKLSNNENNANNFQYEMKADLWSVGIIAYCLAFGYLPFNGSTNEEIYQNIISTELIIPSNHNRSILLITFIKILLQPNINKRGDWNDVFNIIKEYVKHIHPNKANNHHLEKSPKRSLPSPTIKQLSLPPSPTIKQLLLNNNQQQQNIFNTINTTTSNEPSTLSLPPLIIPSPSNHDNHSMKTLILKQIKILERQLNNHLNNKIQRDVLYQLYDLAKAQLQLLQ